ncbi:hypothetical protein CFOL_v3_21228 [Cephalotus follicularis]|uniref:Uncharacterized protein n=1 Tax=Cephalotus follicularis TaxID=3775 RepID=A0A1Q3CCB1_CEPFO|nr:hypothetical protein CFOL_v3_21228 [Cephalotus follicularis]
MEALHDTSDQSNPETALDPSMVVIDKLGAQRETSYHAMACQNLPHTLPLTGTISGFPIQTLIDNESTHNFIQTRMALYLGPEVHATPCLSVVVGNGQRLTSDGFHN